MNKYISLAALGLLLLAMAFLIAHQMGLWDDFAFNPQAEQARQERVAGPPQVKMKVPPPDSEEGRRRTVGGDLPPLPSQSAIEGSLETKVENSSGQEIAPPGPPPRPGRKDEQVESPPAPPSPTQTVAAAKPQATAKTPPAPEPAPKPAPIVAPLPLPTKHAASEAAPAPAPAPAKTQSAPKPESAPTAEAPAAAVEAEARHGVITSITVKRDGQGALLSIVTAEPIGRYKYFTLQGPPRLVIDLIGSWKMSSRPRVEDNLAVKDVRLGLHKEWRRVVVDLINPRKTEVEQVSPTELRANF